MTDSSTEADASPRRRARALVLLGALAVGAVLLALWPRSPRDTELPSTETAPNVVQELPAVDSATPAVDAALAVESGATLTLSLASLPDAPLVVDLLFPEASTTTEPLPARIVGPSSQVLEMQARVEGETRRRARIEIPPGWLSSGRYIIEVKTTERSHFPLRRYALEVR